MHYVDAIVMVVCVSSVEATSVSTLNFLVLILPWLTVYGNAILSSSLKNTTEYFAFLLECFRFALINRFVSFCQSRCQRHRHFLYFDMFLRLVDTCQADSFAIFLVFSTFCICTDSFHAFYRMTQPQIIFSFTIKYESRNFHRQQKYRSNEMKRKKNHIWYTKQKATYTQRHNYVVFIFF